MRILGKKQRGDWVKTVICPAYVKRGLIYYEPCDTRLEITEDDLFELQIYRKMVINNNNNNKHYYLSNIKVNNKTLYRYICIKCPICKNNSIMTNLALEGIDPRKLKIRRYVFPIDEYIDSFSCVIL